MEYSILHPCPIICKSFLKYQDFSSFYFIRAPCTFLRSTLPVTFNVIVLWQWLCYVMLPYRMFYTTDLIEENKTTYILLCLRVDPLLRVRAVWNLESFFVYSTSVCSFWMSWLLNAIIITDQWVISHSQNIQFTSYNFVCSAFHSILSGRVELKFVDNQINKLIKFDAYNIGYN